MRVALMHHSGGMPGSFLHGVYLAFSYSVVLPSRRLARCAAMRVSSVVTTLSDWMKASRKSSSASNRSALVMLPFGSFSCALPSATSLLVLWS